MSFKYHFKPEELIKGITPDKMGLEYTSCRRYEMNSGSEPLTIESGKEEICMVIIKGSVSFDYNGYGDNAGFMDCIYVPRESKIMLKDPEDAVIMKFGAPSDSNTSFACIKHKEIAQDSRRSPIYGTPKENCRRVVYNYLDDNFNASRLMVGICQGEPGGWTAWPPHEHAAQREELYVYFDMGTAFSVQCVYENIDDPLFVGIVRDGDLVSIPGGYHPNVCCPAGRISYIYVMAAKKAGERNFMDLNVQREYGDKFK